MPRVSKTPARRTKTSRSRSTSTRRKSKSLFGSLGAVALFQPLRLNRYRALLAVGVVAVVGAAAVAYTFAASSYSFWSATATPNKTATDAQAVELGLRFTADTTGTVTGVKFYKATTNTGSHTGSLWNNQGQLLGTVTFSGETASGWQTAKFAQPIQIAANQQYTVSYHTNVGHYSLNRNYFTTARTKGPLHAPANTASSPNGVYTYGASAYPAMGSGASNFWVDVLFSQSVAATPTPSATPVPTPTGTPITGTTTCPLPAYPSVSCTGRPSSLGATYTKVVDGDYTVTTAGAVLDNWHITGDVDIRAAGVTIQNSQVDGSITNDGNAGTSYSVLDSSVGPLDGSCAKGGLPSLNGHDITAARVYMHGHQDGLDMGGDNINVRDSLLQPCFLPASIVGSDGYHSDGVQDQCSTTCSNIALTHNTIDARAIYNGIPTGNSALNLGSKADGLHLRGVSLVNNLFLGGGYSTALQWDGGATWSIFGNSWVSKSWAYAPISTENTCANQNWGGNSIVTVDSAYNISSTVSATACVN